MDNIKSEMRFIERTPDTTMCPFRSQGDMIVPCSLHCVFLHKMRHRLKDNTYPEIYYCGNANGIEPMEPRI